MKLINTKTTEYDYLNEYEYYFDELNTADNIKELLNNLRVHGYILKSIEFTYIHDDCICKPGIEYTSFDDFNERCNKIDKEDLSVISVEMVNNGVEISGYIGLHHNLFEMFVKKMNQKLKCPAIIKL